MAGMRNAFRRVLMSKGAWALLVGIGVMLSGTGRAVATDVETRDFTIQVDGKAAGEYHMTIRRQDDGTVTLAAQSEVHVSVLLVNVYNYAYRGQEVWKGGRLQHFESSGKENSKSFAITADPDAAGLRVKANGQEHVARADVWTTSCWQLPGPQYRNQAVPLLECDNGQDTIGQLHQVGTEQLKIAGQEQTCVHYRLQRDVPYDLWYDGQDRLVREEWTSKGHHTVLELVHVGH